MNERRLATPAFHAHRSAITGLVCVQGLNLIVTSGTDNALRVFNLAPRTRKPQLIRSRSGHLHPPSVLSFVNDDGTPTQSGSTLAGGSSCIAASIAASSPSDVLLSGAPDHTLRLFHTIRDEESTELSILSTLRQKGKAPANSLFHERNTPYGLESQAGKAAENARMMAEWGTRDADQLSLRPAVGFAIGLLYFLLIPAFLSLL